MILYAEILHVDFFAGVWVLQYQDLDRLIILLEARASSPALHSRVVRLLLSSDDNPLSLLVLPMRSLKLVSLTIIIQIIALRRAKATTSFEACGFQLGLIIFFAFGVTF